MIELFDTAALWPLFIVTALLIARSLVINRRIHTNSPRAHSDVNHPTSIAICKKDGYHDAFPSLDKVDIPTEPEAEGQMVKDKKLYLRLQNIEDHPGE
jgi:hypothetical protein